MFQEMKEPVCLIGSDSDGQLCVLKEAKDILNSITQPVVVVSVVGLYRTGKSYLMNRLAGHQSGFALGSTIESKTKGIWMWCVPHPTKSGHTLVLLDTEGLGDVDKGDEKHDTWIFCMAVLLSSTLVYNSLGVIDNVALQKLHFVKELTENIRVKVKTETDCDESTDFMQIFPSFIWTVRDFTLKLEKDGVAITADEYLEGALALKSGYSSKVEQYNLPRRCLRNFFAERRCFVFNRPAKDDDLQRMEQLKEEELEPRFQQQAKEFLSYVFSSAKPKTVTNGRVLTGIVLGSLVEVYVAAIRSGKVPCLENAVETLAKLQNDKAVEQALQVYRESIYESVMFPVEPSVLSEIHGKTEKKALDAFYTTSFNDVEQKAQLELMRKINEEYKDLCSMNQEQCRSICESELKLIFTPLDQALEDGTFMQPGGHQKYKGQLQSLIKEYREITEKQLMNEEVLTKYLKEKERFEKSILLSDQLLTEAERKHEEKRLQAELLEQGKRAAEEQKQLLEQERQDSEKTYQENIKQLLERKNQEIERIKEEKQRVVEAKLKEHEALLTEGFQQQAEELKKEISRLKSEMKKEEESKPSTLSTIVDTVGTAASMFLPGFIPKAIGCGLSFLARLF